MKAKPRILYFVDDFESEIGGTEQNFVWLLRRIPEEEFEKYFLVFSTVGASDPVTLPIVPRCLGEEFGLGWKAWRRRIREAGRFIEEKQIDLVHVATINSELAATLSSLASGLRVNLLANRRDIGYRRTWRGKLVSRFIQRLGAHYVADSEAVRQSAHRLEGIRLDRIEVIPAKEFEFSEFQEQEILGRYIDLYHRLANR